MAVDEPHGNDGTQAVDSEGSSTSAVDSATGGQPTVNWEKEAKDAFSQRDAGKKEVEALRAELEGMRGQLKPAEQLRADYEALQGRYSDLETSHGKLVAQGRMATAVESAAAKVPADHRKQVVAQLKAYHLDGQLDLTAEKAEPVVEKAMELLKADYPDLFKEAEDPKSTVDVHRVPKPNGANAANWEAPKPHSGMFDRRGTRLL